MKTVFQIISTIWKFLENLFSLFNLSSLNNKPNKTGKTLGEDGTIEPDEVDE